MHVFSYPRKVFDMKLLSAGFYFLTDFLGFLTDFLGFLTDFLGFLTDFLGFLTDFLGFLTDFLGFLTNFEPNRKNSPILLVMSGPPGRLIHSFSNITHSIFMFFYHLFYIIISCRIISSTSFVVFYVCFGSNFQ